MSQLWGIPLFSLAVFAALVAFAVVKTRWLDKKSAAAIAPLPAPLPLPVLPVGDNGNAAVIEMLGRLEAAQHSTITALQTLTALNGGTRDVLIATLQAIQAEVKFVEAPVTALMRCEDLLRMIAAGVSGRAGAAAQVSIPPEFTSSVDTLRTSVRAATIAVNEARSLHEKSAALHAQILAAGAAIPPGVSASPLAAALIASPEPSRGELHATVRVAMADQYAFEGEHGAAQRERLRDFAWGHLMQFPHGHYNHDQRLESVRLRTLALLKWDPSAHGGALEPRDLRDEIALTLPRDDETPAHVGTHPGAAHAKGKGRG